MQETIQVMQSVDQAGVNRKASFLPSLDSEGSKPDVKNFRVPDLPDFQ